jgi:chromate transport protein ChrA
MALVAIVLVVVLGWLFLEISRPGKRTVPVLMITAGLAAAILLFRVMPPVALLLGVSGLIAGFLTAAITGGKPGDSGKPPYLH